MTLRMTLCSRPLPAEQVLRNEHKHLPPWSTLPTGTNKSIWVQTLNSDVDVFEQGWAHAVISGAAVEPSHLDCGRAQRQCGLVRRAVYLNPVGARTCRECLGES